MLIIHYKLRLPLNCYKTKPQKAITAWSVSNLNGQGCFRCCWVFCLWCRSTEVPQKYHTCQSHVDVSDTLELVHIKGHQMPLLRPLKKMSDITFGPQSSTLQDTSMPQSFATSAIWMSWRAVWCRRCILSSVEHKKEFSWPTRLLEGDKPCSDLHMYCFSFFFVHWM